MKLIIAVVQDEDVGQALDALVQADYRATKVGSTGGFLRKGNSTVIAGVEDDRVDHVIGVIRDNCRTRTEVMLPGGFVHDANLFMPEPIEVEVGGAVIFVLDMEQFLRV